MADENIGINNIDAEKAKDINSSPKTKLKVIHSAEETTGGSANMYISEKEQLALKDDIEKNFWKNVGRRMKRDWRLYLMILPVVLVFLFWRYLPLYGLIGAFKVNDPTTEIWERTFVGLHWFRQITVGSHAVEFWQAFRNTFFLSFYNMLFGFPVPIIIALFFNEIKNNIVRSGLQVLTYLPRFVSTVVITTMIHMLLKGAGETSQPGIIAQLLAKIGIISQNSANVGMLKMPQYFRAIYIISGIWETAGYGSIVFFAAIIGISPTQYEAANIDGASKMSQVRYVVLPGMASTIIIMLILRIGELMSVGYEKVLLLYNRDIYETADIVSTFVFRIAGMDAGLGASNPAMGSAADMIAAVISMLMVIGSNKISRRVSDVSLY